jgi:predicted O-methyltransferase YrrM
VPKMNKAGVIYLITSSGGKSPRTVKPKDISTKVLLDYNNLLINDPRVETVLLPIRDGLTVSRVPVLAPTFYLC